MGVFFDGGFFDGGFFDNPQPDAQLGGGTSRKLRRKKRIPQDAMVPIPTDIIYARESVRDEGAEIAASQAARRSREDRALLMILAVV